MIYSKEAGHIEIRKTYFTDRQGLRPCWGLFKERHLVKEFFDFDKLVQYLKSHGFAYQEEEL